MIKLLDCTLRDGGYINNWQFGRKEINRIASCLVNSGMLLSCMFEKTIPTTDIDLYVPFDYIFADNKKPAVSLSAKRLVWVYSIYMVGCNP